MVCRAVAQQTRGDTGLLLAALDLPAVTVRYEQSHGLCLHHALQVPVVDPGARLIRRIATARARVLEAELGEADRKQGWLARHEAAGAGDVRVAARARTAARRDVPRRTGPDLVRASI